VREIGQKPANTVEDRFEDIAPAASGARDSGLTVKELLGLVLGESPGLCRELCAGLGFKTGPCRVKSGKRLEKMSATCHQLCLTREALMRERRGKEQIAFSILVNSNPNRPDVSFGSEPDNPDRAMSRNRDQGRINCLMARSHEFKLKSAVVQLLLMAGFSGACVGADGHTNLAAAGIIAPQTIAFRRIKEPKEGAFSFLAPPNWTTEINLFRIDPRQVGGWGNSLAAKCDLTVRKDDAGTVMLHSLPTYSYVDFSVNPKLATRGAMLRPGSHYQGMQVKPMPAVQGILDEMFKFVHPRAQEAKVTERKELPELAGVFAKVNQSADAEVAAVGARIT
jgi:hypothetical protein